MKLNQCESELERIIEMFKDGALDTGGEALSSQETQQDTPTNRKTVRKYLGNSFFKRASVSPNGSGSDTDAEGVFVRNGRVGSPTHSNKSNRSSPPRSITSPVPSIRSQASDHSEDDPEDVLGIQHVLSELTKDLEDEGTSEGNGTRRRRRNGSHISKCSTDRFQT